MPKKLIKRRRNKSWKNLKVVKKVVRALKLTVFAFFALFVSGALIASVSLYKFVKTPFASSEVSPHEKALNVNEPFTISFIVLEDKSDESSKIKNLAFIVVNPKDAKLNVFTIEPTMTLDLPQRFGEGSLDKLYALGELVEKKKGLYLTNKALERIFARRVDRHILTDEEGLKEVSDYFSVSSSKDVPEMFSLKNISKLPSGVTVLRNNFETDLAFNELFMIGKLLSGITKESINIFAIDSFAPLDYYAIDQKTQNLFLVDEILSEHKRIAVLNGAGIYRLGSFVSRLITNIGGDVVSISNTPETYTKSLILTDDVNSKTLYEIKKAFGEFEVVKPGDFAKASELSVVGADITIIVGIDYANSL